MFIFFVLKHLLFKNYTTNYMLNGIIDECIPFGIKKVSSSGTYTINIEFNNDVIISGWNVNRYYAWLSQGKVTFPDGEEYAWEYGMPSRKNIYRLNKLLNEFSKYE